MVLLLFYLAFAVFTLWMIDPIEIVANLSFTTKILGWLICGLCALLWAVLFLVVAGAIIAGRLSALGGPGGRK